MKKESAQPEATAADEPDFSLFTPEQVDEIKSIAQAFGVENNGIKIFSSSSEQPEGPE